MQKVIIGLKGGLGNQMFQYAFGELLRRKYGRDVYYDKGFFNGPFSERVTPRKYELDAFGIKLAKEVDFKFYKSTKPLKRLGRKLIGIPAFDIFHDPEHYVDPATLPRDRSIYLDGYWQNFRYVEPLLDELRSEFVLDDTQFSKEYRRWFEQITADEKSVAVHVRRGDYVTNAAASELFVLCSVDYYKKAMELIKEKVSGAKFYFFSDDLSWVKENLGDANSSYVETRSHFEDFQLMRTCRHSIIANSSFSWWGATLKSSEEAGMVVAPLDWLSQSSYDRDLPASWLKI